MAVYVRYKSKKPVAVVATGPKRGVARYRARRKNRKQTRNRNSVPVGLGFPKRMVMTHKYNEQFAFNTGVNGTLNYMSFSCNGMYDPNLTGVGHQPMYFDQMSALYNHYTVIGSQIIIKVAKSDSNTNIPLIYGCFVNDDSTVTASNVASLDELSVSKHRVLTSYRPQTLKLKWSAKKTFAGSILGNDNLIGTSGSNPTEYQAYTFFMDSSTNVTQTSVMLDVEIRYIAVWTELKDIAGS